MNNLMTNVKLMLVDGGHWAQIEEAVAGVATAGCPTILLKANKRT